MKSDTPPVGDDTRFEPQQIAIRDNEGCVVILWQDGHQSRYANWYLRGFCPCAVCQGHGGPLSYVQAAQNPELRLLSLDAVGHYAVTMVWSDGHKTGIYTLDALRNMCPCKTCRQGPLGRTMMQLLPQSRRNLLETLS